MKTIGILGGMSAASTALYYAQLNALAQARLGRLHSAEILLRSVDFAPIAAMQAAGDWASAGRVLARHAAALQAGGADLVVLATNTMHKLTAEITGAISIPFVHIADATAAVIVAAGWRRPGLIATAYTMEQDFYIGRLAAARLDTLVPEATDRAAIHRVIYDELCLGLVTDASRARFQAIAADLVARGADCMIFGCTEVGMLLNQGNVSVPVYDTVAVHCVAAMDLAMQGADTPQGDDDV